MREVVGPPSGVSFENHLGKSDVMYKSPVLLVKDPKTLVLVPEFVAGIPLYQD